MKENTFNKIEQNDDVEINGTKFANMKLQINPNSELGKKLDKYTEESKKYEYLYFSREKIIENIKNLKDKTFTNTEFFKAVEKALGKINGDLKVAVEEIKEGIKKYTYHVYDENSRLDRPMNHLDRYILIVEVKDSNVNVIETNIE